MSQSKYKPHSKESARPIYINGKMVAAMRGNTCDIRRRSNGFLYNPHRVAISEQLLQTLSDGVLLKFTNLENGDVWTISAAEFREHAEPIQYGNFEPQQAVEIARMDCVKTLKYKSRAPQGVKFTPGKQLTLWGKQ